MLNTAGYNGLEKRVRERKRGLLFGGIKGVSLGASICPRRPTKEKRTAAHP